MFIWEGRGSQQKGGRAEEASKTIFQNPKSCFVYVFAVFPGQAGQTGQAGEGKAGMEGQGGRAGRFVNYIAYFGITNN